MNQEIIKLRQELHKHPEVSNDEYHTSERIINYVKKFNPDEIIKLGETGVAFIFNGKEKGKTVVFRSELDALLIKEKSGVEYASVNDHIAHSCGHDGHMAILTGLIQVISKNRPVRGKVVMLFQPAEEVEQGACDVVENPKFINIQPDYLFALHNVPGFEKHTIVLKKGSFASASKGMTIKLTGKTVHAAEPQDGISPADAISDIIKELHVIRDDKTLFKDFVLLTIIHIQLGEISFGTSPGYAELRVTLRAFENEDMEVLTDKCEKTIREISRSEKLDCEISYSEDFPATVNNDYCVGVVEQSAKHIGLDIQNIEKPFKWSEDFGYFTEKYNACYFGLGSGKDQPQLHNPDFDFPDDIIESGINIFYAIYEKALSDD
ncbi:amidohydrolase [Ancylomarina euxinus]|uniref:Amidohydrolase n=1 Tax=Ancylomarina euxinus TaxID=2283627 RepID=A0A425Y2Y9_9BACT|nr:amidohydrolase [Ancylomarina euxinus]MCZ4693205.1 amidohydrolase [Ancylomarina euxinus]MUP15341.1 amidohydrolase [Ancylomarina euxinus]RRG22532.1 amidohydrolase [Ancylomarina euxinus]